MKMRNVKESILDDSYEEGRFREKENQSIYMGVLIFHMFDIQ